MRSAGRDERTNEQCAGQHQTEGDGQLAEQAPLFLHSVCRLEIHRIGPELFVLA